MIKLKDYQLESVSQLKTGSILCGGVGSGKSLTSLVYYFTKECGGKIKTDDQSNFSPPLTPKDLYIITVAKKRDSLDWEKECSNLMLSTDRTSSISEIKVTVDSWNNIFKYSDIKDCFFIFDEQRVIGAGSWVKSFLRITKKNNWILLSATPGDTWLDYIPVFLANGFYKNRTDFLRQHVIYNNFTKFPKIDHYIDTAILNQYKKSIMVVMKYEKKTRSHFIDIKVNIDRPTFELAAKARWNPFTNEPIQNISEFCYVLRKIVNSHPSRLEFVKNLISKYGKIIIFYNFDYELEILRNLKDIKEIEVAEYNGHKHQDIPKTSRWVYLVQYTSGSEAWNCIETNITLFYSLNYSYRVMLQSSGRIDRMNSPFPDLYYYQLISDSSIDDGIKLALKEKKDFNEKNFVSSRAEHML